MFTKHTCNFTRPGWYDPTIMTGLVEWHRTDTRTLHSVYIFSAQGANQFIGEATLGLIRTPADTR